jgi:hypothetical protein
MIIFRTSFNSDIGLKSFGEVGESIFGMRMIKEELILSRATFSS